MGILNAQDVILKGLVVDGGRKPIIGAVAALHELHRKTITDTLGYFVMKGLRAGSYHLHLTAVGYQAYTQTVRLTPDSSTFTFVLTETHLELPGAVIEVDPIKADLREQSLTIEAIDATYLEKNIGTNLLTALATLPGLSLINVGTGVAKPVIRGLSLNRVAVFDNGIRQEGQQWGADHGLELDAYNVNRVEIIKGPASVIYGPEAMGGVIVIHPPEDPKENTHQATFRAGYQSVNQNWISSTQVAGHQKDVVYRFRFTTQDYADYQVPASSFNYNRWILPIFDQKLKNTAGQERNIAAMIGLHGHWGFSHLTVSHFDQQVGLFTGAFGMPSLQNTLPDGSNFNIDLPMFDTKHLKIISNNRFLFGKNWLELDLGYQRNQRRELARPHGLNTFIARSTTRALDLILATYTLNTRYHFWFSEHTDGVFGFSGQVQRNDRDGYEFLLPAFSFSQAGVYYYHKYRPHARLTVNAGLRGDAGLQHLNGFTQPLFDYSGNMVGQLVRSVSLNKRYGSVCGTVGVSYFPTEVLNVKVNFGTDFRFPVPVELGGNGVHHGTFRHEQGDSSLTTERGYQFDLNLTYQKKSMLVRLSPFFGYFNNFIYLRPTGEFSFLPEGGQIYRYTQASTRLLGGELLLEYHALRALHLSGQVSFLRGDNLQTALPLPFMPPNNAALEVGYAFTNLPKPLTHIDLSLNLRGFADQNRVDRNELQTPGYATVNGSLSIGFKFGRVPVKVVVNGFNLANRVYMHHLSRYRMLNLPEPGRNVVLSILIG